MINRILTVALVAGLLAGLATAILQHFSTVPLVLAAETFEAAGHSHDDGTSVAHDHGPAAAGFGRFAGTLVTTLAAAVGLALVMLAGMVLAQDEPTPRRALAWAAAGFVAFSLAPAMGLSPELPGMTGAPLIERQIWWVATVAATAGGLFLALHVGRPIAIAAGLALIGLPHLVGAPHPPAGIESAVPAELAARFAASSLGLAAVMWSLIGLGIGVAWQRLGAARPQPAGAA